jgi:hypothetical protein
MSAFGQSEEDAFGMPPAPEERSLPRRLLYSSPNGDQWYLAKEAEAGRVFIVHEPNTASGGRVSQIELGSFMNRSGHGPEHQELVRLIGTLIEDR